MIKKFAYFIKFDCLLTSSINHKYIVKMRHFVTAKTDDMYDHMKPMQRNFRRSNLKEKENGRYRSWKSWGVL